MSTPKKTNGRWHSLAIRGEIYEKLVEEHNTTGESVQKVANKRLAKSLKLAVPKLA